LPSPPISETITETNGKAATSEIPCNTAGASCKVKDHGAAEVSFWSNGGMLAMSEMRHGDGLGGEAPLEPATGVIEAIHLAPTQATARLTFTRQ
jgi:hypothetical protein